LRWHTATSFSVSSNIENNFEYDSLNYVRKQTDFKYKDDVDAGVLVMILEELGYLKFANRHNEKRYHIITEKGFDYLSKIN
jgi:hypothetical protein